MSLCLLRFSPLFHFLPFILISSVSPHLLSLFHSPYLTPPLPPALPPPPSTIPLTSAPLFPCPFPFPLLLPFFPPLPPPFPPFKPDFIYSFSPYPPPLPELSIKRVRENPSRFYSCVTSYTFLFLTLLGFLTECTLFSNILAVTDSKKDLIWCF